MPKTPKSRRRMGRWDNFIPCLSPKVGDKVYWEKVYHFQGIPSRRWWTGNVEVRRGREVVVRDDHGHEHTLGVSRLFKAKPT